MLLPYTVYRFKSKLMYSKQCYFYRTYQKTFKNVTDVFLVHIYDKEFLYVLYMFFIHHNFIKYDSMYVYIEHLFYNVYILSVFTEKPYSKSLERNEVYIPIITLSHAKSHDFK